jgi:hypothetical protein
VRLLSDLAPNEVYIAETLTHLAGGLLHHRFTLTAFAAVYFLLHYLAGYPEWLLATVLLYGARTFLVISAATVLPTHPS